MDYAGRGRRCQRTRIEVRGVGGLKRWKAKDEGAGSWVEG